MKCTLSSEEEQIVYNVGYNDGTKDQFMPVLVVGICCTIMGIIVGLCI